jgi:hypothetical protein
MTATELCGEARVRRSPMEREAMRLFNIVANRFFADAFSFVLGQRFEDRLCGTKMLSWFRYERWTARREFFCDFDLLFGAPRIRLRLFSAVARARLTSGASRGSVDRNRN